ncbi:protein of unknown function (DUF1793) [Geosmithia morbida]|uniref:Glutaminase n=1 Tax=Geosmithia morbida TaxID=1094350 RepID=A0A9P5CZN0_9HYPO|nr:protein of unknown function (DUF1793) [Geosmithia morbida]KAF4121773.1 protein of unknown function (DUF1793) [Geosmithia morbida]
MAMGTSASTLRPPVLPLLVRTPYLSTWLPNARSPPWESWPIFWTGEQVGLSVMVSIPDSGQVFPLLGRPQDSLPSDLPLSEPKHHDISFDASTTNITYHLQLGFDASAFAYVTLSFLSPVTPTSVFRQSLPAAYVTIYVEGPARVNVYADLNGKWISGKDDSAIIWNFDQRGQSQASSAIKSWKVSRETEQLFTETNDRAEWGTLYFSGPETAAHQSGPSDLLRQTFARLKQLSNTTDEDYRQIMDREPVFAFSTSLEPGYYEASEKNSVTFTVGLVQDPVAQFAAARGLTEMRPFWKSLIPDEADMINFHYHDFGKASFLASNYSARLDFDARLVGSESYPDLVALSARQVLGATTFSGTPQDPILFLKEISSNGNFQTVDVIYPAFPFFLYTNPTWLTYLLEPLLEYQLSGQYPRNYSIHDIGTHFPNGTGHSDGNDEYMPLEECGNMLIMALAVVNAIGEEPVLMELTPSASSEAVFHQPLLAGQSGPRFARKWAKKSYSLWKLWADYLVRETLIPENQLCTDDFAGLLPNQTNLALKGIIGLRAMSDIAAIVGNEQDAEHYKNISVSYINKWQEYGISRDGTHAKLGYEWFGSWTTLYNLFADTLLCFHNPANDLEDGEDTTQSPIGAKPQPEHFIPDKIYSMSSQWYPNVMQKYGLPLDSRHLYAKSDWELFAASVASTKTREEIIERVGLWINETITGKPVFILTTPEATKKARTNSAVDRPLTDLYDTEGEGNFDPVPFKARPVVGGHFAPLSLQRACNGRALKGLRFLDVEQRIEETSTEGKPVGEKSASGEL